MTNEQIIENSTHSYEEIVDIPHTDDLKYNLDWQFRLKDLKQINAMNETRT